MKFFFSVVVFFLISANTLAADLPVSQNTKQKTIPATVAQTESPPEQSSQPSVDQKYIELLERVNQQISFTWNPYNIILVILSALIGFSAIGAAFFIFMQERGYRNRLKRNEEDFTNRMKTFFEEQLFKAEQSNAIRIEKLLVLDKRFDAFSEKLKSFDHKTPSTEELDDIKKELEKIKADQLQVANLSGVASTVFIESGSIGSHIHKCSHCGFGYKRFGVVMSDMFSHSVIGPSSSESVTCPKCGNVDLI